jgi:hypothetical protein
MSVPLSIKVTHSNRDVGMEGTHLYGLGLGQRFEPLPLHRPRHCWSTCSASRLSGKYSMGKNRAQSSARNFKTEADLAFWAGAMTEPTARPVLPRSIPIGARQKGRP